MNPSDYDPIFDRMSEKFGLDRKFFKLLVKEYYKQVRKEIAEINTTRIDLLGIGSFDLKYYKIKYKLRDTKNFITYHEKKKSIRSIAILINLEKKLKVLNQAKKLADDRQNKETEIRNARKEHISKNKKGLEKQG